MMTRRLAITSCAIVLATGVLCDAPAFAAESGLRMYAVTSQADTAGQGITTRELLAIGSSAGKQFVRISNGDTTVSFAANVESDGEITTKGADSAVICYNMAASVLAAHDKTPNEAVPLYLRFLDQIVPVPLTIHTQQSNGTSLLSFDGRNVGMLSNAQSSIPSGLFVQGQIAEQNGTIESATFEEATVAGMPAQRISGTNCSLAAVAPTLGA